MKNGLTYLPTKINLLEAYDRHLGKSSIRQWVLDSQWTRFDPRLAEIWVNNMCTHWMNLNPLEFHSELLQQPWPNAAGVLLEFVQKRIPKLDRPLFLTWKAVILVGVKPAQFEQYFIGLRKIASALMTEDAEFSTKEYLKWGYLSQEILFNKANAASFSTHSFSMNTRHEIIKRLLKECESLSTTEYRNAIGKCVSRRQAERDLLSSPFLKALGNTKSRVFVKKK